MITNGTLDFIKNQIADQFLVNHFVDDMVEVSVPYFSGDGDGYTIFVKRIGNNRWSVTDLGETINQVSVTGVDLLNERYAEQLKRIAHYFDLTISEGKLSTEKDDDTLGEAIHTMTQACFEVGRLTQPAAARMRREGQRELILKKTIPLIKRVVGRKKLHFDWNDPVNDLEGAYPVDIMLDCGEPVLMSTVASSQDVWRVSAVFGYFRSLDLNRRSVAIVRARRKPIEEKRLIDVGAEILDSSLPKEFESRLKELCHYQ
jgi:hypothetical protein